MVNDTQSYIAIFDDKDAVENFQEVVNMHWKNVYFYVKNISEFIAEQDKRKFDMFCNKPCFIVVLHLGWKMGWTTTKNRLGPQVIEDIRYLMKCNLNEDPDNGMAMIEAAINNFKVSVRNKLNSINIEAEIEKEALYANKKRKFNDDDSDNTKKQCWF